MAAILAAPACAQEDRAHAAEAPENVAETCVTPETTMVPVDALALSNNCDAVIYYNEAVSEFQAQGAARALRNHQIGYDVIAVSGFPGENQVVVLREGSLASARPFSGDEMATVGAFILEQMGHPVPVRTAQVTEASFEN